MCFQETKRQIIAHCTNPVVLQTEQNLLTFPEGIILFLYEIRKWGHRQVTGRRTMRCELFLQNNVTHFTFKLKQEPGTTERIYGSCNILLNKESSCLSRLPVLFAPTKQSRWKTRHVCNCCSTSNSLHLYIFNICIIFLGKLQFCEGPSRGEQQTARHWRRHMPGNTNMQVLLKPHPLCNFEYRCVHVNSAWTLISLTNTGSSFGHANRNTLCALIVSSFLLHRI